MGIAIWFDSWRSGGDIWMVPAQASKPGRGCPATAISVPASFAADFSFLIIALHLLTPILPLAGNLCRRLPVCTGLSAFAVLRPGQTVLQALQKYAFRHAQLLLAIPQQINIQIGNAGSRHSSPCATSRAATCSGRLPMPKPARTSRRTSSRLEEAAMILPV